MKHISILGSTGSIGKQALDVIKSNPDKFNVIGLAANNNIEILEKQIMDFNPIAVCVMNPEKADLLKSKVDIEVFSGMDGLKKVSSLHEADTVINSLVGSIGIEPTLEAIGHKKNIALANKETLVTAGEIVMREAMRNDVKILPIDSEHSAILQCIKGEKISAISKITLTCSGGPFRKLSLEQMRDVSVKDALNHPTWNMGAKITIDSATLMNKGFEVIEAHWLYGIPYEKIDVVIHPESIIHSLVEFHDCSTVAQLSIPDMRIPIQYALTYPERIHLESKSLNLMKIKSLNFESPDTEKFPCIRYAYESGKTGGTMPAVLNAANEAAVKMFLDGKIRFNQISEIIMSAINEHKVIKHPELDEILEVDKKIKSDLLK